MGWCNPPLFLFQRITLKEVLLYFSKKLEVKSIFFLLQAIKWIYIGIPSRKIGSNPLISMVYKDLKSAHKMQYAYLKVQNIYQCAYLHFVIELIL